MSVCEDGEKRTDGAQYAKQNAFGDAMVWILSGFDTGIIPAVCAIGIRRYGAHTGVDGEVALKKIRLIQQDAFKEGLLGA
jgi:hypothetical protein